MLKVLEGLQYGFDTPKSYQTSVINHRVANLSRSMYTGLELFHANVNSLDLEKIEERYLLSGSNLGALCIHDLQNSTGMACYEAKIVAELPRDDRYSHKCSISTVQWYPFDTTGKFLSSGVKGMLKIWEASVMKPAKEFNLHMKISSHHMSPIATQHSLIALAMENSHAVLLDPRSGSYCHQLRGHKTALSCVRWSPICEYLIATGGVDSMIFLWDIRSAKCYLSSLDQYNGEARGNCRDLTTAHNGAINSMRFTDDGLLLVSFGADSKVRLWDVALSLNTLVNYGIVPSSHQYNRSPMIEVCCNTNPPVIFVPSSNRIICLDLFHGHIISCLVDHSKPVNCCAYRSSTNQLYSSGSDCRLRLWSPDSKKVSIENDERFEERVTLSTCRDVLFKIISEINL